MAGTTPVRSMEVTMNATQWRARSGRPARHAGKRRCAAAVVLTAIVGGAAPLGMAAGDDSLSALLAAAGTELRDTAITAKAKAALAGKEDLSSGDIHVTTQRGDVVLTGSVPDTSQRATAVNIVRQLDGVRDVRDQLAVRAK
ncbi:transport-associated protein [Burkholderia ubonensis]|uniref:Transport-associated protein n=2 Tax=Burkholderia ubonensis TaxID=101571 RepID=A0A1R1JI98_9BURK|nr:transport-associated protein [Burkholderia ubonensis]